MKFIFFILLLFVSIFLVFRMIVVQFSNSPEISSFWLDHSSTQDPSLSDSSYLVSTRFQDYSESVLNRPVIIGVHGYTASTYEMLELKDYIQSNSNVMVSLVLLGAHGRSYDVFKASTWEDWANPIIEEYERLEKLGFKNISFVGASVGGALLMELLASGKLESYSVKPNNFFLVDAFLESQDKNLRWVPYLKYVLKEMVLTDMPVEDHAYWYAIRPVSTLIELVKLTDHLKAYLNEGIRLFGEMNVFIYQSDDDTVVDPKSATLFYDGLRFDHTNTVQLHSVESKHHVFCRLKGRSDSSQSDKQLQELFFDTVIKHSSFK